MDSMLHIDSILYVVQWTQSIDAVAECTTSSLVVQASVSIDLDCSLNIGSAENLIEVIISFSSVRINSQIVFFFSFIINKKNLLSFKSFLEHPKNNV